LDIPSRIPSNQIHVKEWDIMGPHRVGRQTIYAPLSQRQEKSQNERLSTDPQRRSRHTHSHDEARPYALCYTDHVKLLVDHQAESDGVLDDNVATMIIMMVGWLFAQQVRFGIVSYSEYASTPSVPVYRASKSSITAKRPVWGRHPNVPVAHHGDPYGVEDSLRVHVRQQEYELRQCASLTTPDIKWPSDLHKFDLPGQCRLDMTDNDIKMGKEFIQKNPVWMKELGYYGQDEEKGRDSGAFVVWLSVHYRNLLARRRLDLKYSVDPCLYIKQFEFVL
jgi:hypothetical protein